MIDLYNKKTGDKTYIYTVKDDKNGYPKFLIRKNNQWIWDSAKHYMTEKERERTAYTSIEQHFIDTQGYIPNLVYNKFRGENN